jgi:uncharacterized OB-fold protein
MDALINPQVDDLNRPFWDGCAAGELRLQACLRCGLIRYPVADTCPRCLAMDAEWRTMSGRGEILSAVVFHRVYNEAWRERAPYNVVLVQLAEGPRMLSNVLPFSAREIPAGTPVRVVFDTTSQDVAVPRFELDEPEGERAGRPRRA